jgi:WD40 repeat protein
LIASGSWDDTVKLWKLDGTLVRTFVAGSQGVVRVSWSPDGQVIATAGANGLIKLWNIEGKLIKTLPGHRGLITSLAFTPNGNFLTSGSDDGTIFVWDLVKIERVNELRYACDWVKDYLRTNRNLQEDDRKICDDVGTKF